LATRREYSEATYCHALSACFGISAGTICCPTGGMRSPMATVSILSTSKQHFSLLPDNPIEGLNSNRQEKSKMIRKPYCFSQTKEHRMAYYFGIEVQVLQSMDHCSLIHYGDLKVVVETEDLVFRQVRKAAA
jgi:hypothetical protein